MKDLPPFKIGIIGCGHVGTMILTKLLEIQNSFNNLKVIVSTRQPHLLGAFQQEFCVEASYNNERVVRECDIIFMCVLPSQATEVFKEIRLVTEERFVMAAKDKSKSRPLFISCLAATGFNKLRLMLTKDTNFLRTPVKVSVIREYLNRTKNAVPDQALHPAQNIAQTQKEIHNHVLVD
jgi:pyrroline-5-carboxylate reductase